MTILFLSLRVVHVQYLGGTRDSESSRVREPGNFSSRISARTKRISICLAAGSISRSTHRRISARISRISVCLAAKKGGPRVYLSMASCNSTLTVPHELVRMTPTDRSYKEIGPPTPSSPISRKRIGRIGPLEPESSSSKSLREILPSIQNCPAHIIGSRANTPHRTVTSQYTSSPSQFASPVLRASELLFVPPL
eukprot:SAG25_NODE_398_length_8498_cov_16.527206_11_plen_195_part_00